jgi:hypothetical protein
LKQLRRLGIGGGMLVELLANGWVAPVWPLERYWPAQVRNK